MEADQSMNWQPTTIKRFIRGFPTSGHTALVDTDVGQGYLKALGGEEGSHTLACEWVASHLARWLGLSTFEFAIVTLDEFDEIPFFDLQGKRVGTAGRGPAFITRAESGETWSGDEKQLRSLVNPEHVSGLVVLDTWLLNCDRYSRKSDEDPPRINRNNVFLSEEAPRGQLRLKAMDHTHCFTCGAALTKTLGRIDRIRDSRLYGMFPEFRSFIGEKRDDVRAVAARLHDIRRAAVEPVVQSLPKEWDVQESAADALIELIVRRGKHVAETIEQKIWPQLNLELPMDDKTEQKP